MHPYKSKALSSHKSKHSIVTKEQPSGADLCKQYHEHVEETPLKQAKDVAKMHEQKMPKPAAKSKYGEV